MGNKNPTWDKDNDYYRQMFEKFQATQNAELIETPGSPDPLRIVAREDAQALSRDEILATIDPTHDIDTFRAYVARLNRMIKANMPFLSATFLICELSISIVISGGLLPRALKEAFFDCPAAKTSVIVQYTMLPAAGTSMDAGSPVKLRKFGSVRAFMDATRSLDDALLKLQAVSGKAQKKAASEESKGPSLIVAEDEEIKQEQTTMPSDLNLCCICLDNQVQCMLTCFHSYCNACIQDWRARELTCPMCRKRTSRAKEDFAIIDGGAASDHELRLQLIEELTRIISKLIDEKIAFNNRI